MRPSELLFTLLFALLLLGCPGEDSDDFDGDGVSDATDCGPADPTIGPGFVDPWGDAIDSDCDGSDGLDRDGDGFASNATDTDEQRNRDCDDTSVLTFPGAADAVGDGVDSNCDGTDGVDEDGDGWASAASGGVDCNDEDPDLGIARDVDGDGVTDCDGDCDDLDASRNPTLPEACDGADTDCDPTTEPPGGESDGDGDGALGCADCDDADSTREQLDADGDGVSTCAAIPDCDDTAAQINPFESDLAGDGLDTNCDGVDGIDADGDGEASVSSGGADCADSDPTVTSTTDADGDGSAACSDCDDTDPVRAPSLIELCATGVDEDCDGTVDSDADLDGDGFDPCTGDCDESSTVTFPGGFDSWGDGLDLNCDGVDGTDADGDGFAGDALDAPADCDDSDPLVSPLDQDGDGVSPCDGDCDDGDATTFPFASDAACDGVDSNCAPDPLEQDQDGDGYLPCAPYTGAVAGVLGGNDCDDADVGLAPVDADGDGATLCENDCDDADPTRTPGAVEVACDGFDSDCVLDLNEVDQDLDGQLPCEGDCDDLDPAMLAVDADFDGVTPCGPDGLAGTADDDCDDTDGLVFPGATELCDGLDSDCAVDAAELDLDGDGYVVCSPWVGSDPNIVGEADCDDANAAIVPLDADGDGVAGCNGDCDETDAAIYPGAADLACDGLDTNCVADPQELDADGDGDLPCEGDCDDGNATLNLADADGDSWTTCQADCDDADPGAFPFNVDAACDGLDTDCFIDSLEIDDDGDGYVDCQPWSGTVPGIVGGGDCDDASALNVPIDADGDGVAGCGGDCDETDPSIYPGAPDTSCDGLDTDCVTDPAELDADGDGVWPCQGDCDDANAALFPGAIELCNGLDDDCNGTLAGFELDNDGDGFNECGGNDCNDGDPAINPGSMESCDGVDNNCNGVLDDQVDADADGWSTCGPDGVPSSGDEDCDDSDSALNLTDTDGDGFVTCATYYGTDAAILGGNDCDDLDQARWPGNPLWEDPVSDPDLDCNGLPGTGLANFFKILGEAPDDRVGGRLVSLPDIDGDGVPDILLSASGSDSGAADAGKVYLISGAEAAGGTASLPSATAVIIGQVNDQGLGTSIGVADVDGDGVSDILVGSVANGSAQAGETFLFFGSALSGGGSFIPGQADASFLGESAQDYSGSALGGVAGIGDLDGDGLDEIVIGAWGNDSGGTDAGRAYLFFGATIAFGGAFGLGSADVIFEGEQTGDWAGGSVASAGDVDGDGLDDLLIGASRADQGAIDAGATYLVLGASVLSGGVVSLGNADAVFIGVSAGDNSGHRVERAGDVDGDGLGDLLIGAPEHSGAGACYLVLGATVAGGGVFDLSLADMILLGEASGDWAGEHVVAAGDVDGDGLDDLLVGASRNNQAAVLAGKTYFLRGATVASGGVLDLALSDAAFYGSAGSYSGSGLSGAGDLNGDGLSDLLIGAFREAVPGVGANVGAVAFVPSPY